MPGTVLESPYCELLSAAARSTASGLYGPQEVHFEGFGVTNMQVTTQGKGSLHSSDGLAILLWLRISSMDRDKRTAGLNSRASFPSDTL